VTAKYRRFDTAEKTERYTERLIESGAQMLSIHGRTREQKGQFTGLADWEMMRGAISRSHTHERPILGNGNTLVAHDITRLLEETGADGAMVAEGNLYNPAIFAPLNEEGMTRYRAGLPERFKSALAQVEDQYADPTGLLGTAESLREFPLSSKVAAQYLAICRTLQTRTASSAIKGHLYKLFRAVFDTGRYDDVRDALAAVSWNPSTSALTRVAAADTEAWRCASPAGNHQKKRDRVAYEGLLDRFQQVVDRVKLRLEVCFTFSLSLSQVMAPDI
jgi:tRNA-dihydrouridine synthase 1